MRIAQTSRASGVQRKRCSLIGTLPYCLTDKEETYVQSVLLMVSEGF